MIARTSLQRRLAAFPDVAREEAEAALQQTGDDVVAAARASLQAGAGDRDGTLAASLTAALDEEGSRLTIASTSPRAASLEFGTLGRGAHPFLRPAVAAARSLALRHARDAMARAARRFKEGS